MKDALKVYGPLAIAALILFIIAMRMVAPPPPKSITFAAGSAEGRYYALANQYAETLKQHGIEVRVLETAGTVENYGLLLTGDADVALLQGGVAGEAERAGVESLGGMFAEPFWIFVRSDSPVTDFGDLRNSRVGAGPDGSGTRAMTELLQSEWGGTWTDLSDEAGGAAVDALLAGTLEAAVFTASVDANYVQRLLRAPEARLVEVRRASGLAMRDAALSPIILFEGVIDMTANVPREDISLVAAIAQLGVRKGLHPAIQSVLLEAAEPIHGEGSLISEGGTFPDADQIDLPLSDEARRFYRNGPTFLRRYFSFGWANFLERAWVFLIPLVAALIPLAQMAPPVYRWRIRRRIYVWYNDLHDLERRGIEAVTDDDRKTVLDEIHALQMEVGQVNVPVSYNDELYHLRSHINFVEALIARHRIRQT